MHRSFSPWAAALPLVLLCGTGAIACPSSAYPGPTFSYAGADLYAGQAFSTVASGASSLSNCNIPGTRGYANDTATMSMNLSMMEGYELVLDVQSDCNSTLLVNGADGSWSFDDDGGGELMPQLAISDPRRLNGRVDVWIGTYGGGSCPATITFQTRRAAGVADEAGDVPMGTSGTVGCPNTNLTGQAVSYSGGQLWSRQTLPVQASGTTSLSSCAIPETRGYANPAPSYSFYLSGMGEYRLELEAETSCDSTLLVHTPDGRWHFNDDGGDGYNPALSLDTPTNLNGRVDVWVGTYGPTPCSGSLNLETFYGGGAGSQQPGGGQGVVTPIPTPPVAPGQPMHSTGFEGIWSTNLGGMTLIRTGNHVTGTYGDSGSLTGAVTGNTLTGTYTWNGTPGQFQLTLVDSGSAFTGSWSRPGASGTWSGTTMGPISQPAGGQGVTQHPQSGLVPIQGIYSTTVAGDMTLYQNGNQITGSYTCCQGGQISGTLTGNVFDGTYVEDAGTDYGNVRFVFAPDGRSFTGTWSRTSGGQAGGSWNGTRY